jgi:hypothetical protein
VSPFYRLCTHDKHCFLSGRAVAALSSQEPYGSSIRASKSEQKLHQVSWMPETVKSVCVR